MDFWTTWLDYKATNEGSTVMACLTQAADESAAISLFQEKFGEYFAMGCIPEKGLVRNKVTRLLFSKAALDTVEAELGVDNTACIFGSMHLRETQGLQAGLLLGLGESA